MVEIDSDLDWKVLENILRSVIVLFLSIRIVELEEKNENMFKGKDSRNQKLKVEVS